MNCRDRRHDIVLFLYNELGESVQNELRQHIERCDECRAFIESERTLYSDLTANYQEQQMPAELLVECRRHLSEELDRLERRRTWFQLPALAPGVRWLEAAALLSLGLAAGVFVTNQRQTTAGSERYASMTPLVPEDAALSNLRIVDTDPVSGEIELAGDMVSPMRLQGRLEDENFRQLVFDVLSAQTNPGERLRLVEFLATNARDTVVQQALIGSLLHDDNPGVRLYALQGLKPFSADEEVRTALLYVLENDDNPGIRVEAIDALTPLTQDEAMEEVVQEAIRADPNPYIQMRALQFVGR